METAPKGSHIGRKISRLRELRGMKQEALALEMGVSQQAVSRMELSENVEEETLEKVAKVLGLTAAAIKNFNEDALIFHIQNMYDHSANNISYNFNPIEKIVELYNEKVELLERLLQSEKEKVEMLKRKE